VEDNRIVVDRDCLIRVVAVFVLLSYLT